MSDRAASTVLFSILFSIQMGLTVFPYNKNLYFYEPILVVGPTSKK